MPDFFEMFGSKCTEICCGNSSSSLELWNSTNFCAKRHYVRECKTRNVLLRPSVRKIIHFCGRHIGGGHMELLTGSLTHRFFGIPKVDPPKRALRLSIRRSRGPFLGPQKVTFLQNIGKNGLGVFTRCIYYQYCTFSNWRCVTCAQRGYWIGGQVSNCL